MDKICEIYQSRGSLALYLLQCLLFIGVAFIFIHYSDAFSFDCSLREFRKCCFENPVVYETIGKGLATYFGLTSLLVIGYLIRPLCIFYINDEGFYTRNFGFINWQDVLEAALANVSYKKTVVFKVKDSDKLNLSFGYKIIRVFNKKFADNGLVIDFANEENKVDETFKVIQSMISNEK